MTTNEIILTRQQTCAACPEQPTCRAKFRMLEDDMQCPQGRQRTKADLIAARAWPEGVDRISGCCDPIG